jgi:hypothetical protein
MVMLVSSLVEKVLLRNTKFLFINVLDIVQVTSVFFFICFFITDLQAGIVEDGGKWEY